MAKYSEILSRLSRHWRSLQSYLSLHLNCTSEQILSAEEKDCLTRDTESRDKIESDSDKDNAMINKC